MFDKLRLRLAEKLLPGVVFGIPGAETWQEAKHFNMGLALPDGNPDVLTDPYEQHPVVSQFVSIISEDAACVPMELRKTDENGKVTPEVIEDHPVLDVLEAANEWSKGSSLWSDTYAWSIYCGEFFWYYPRVRLGTVDSPIATRVSRNAEIEILDPRLVVDKVDRQRNVTFGVKREEMRDPEPLKKDRLTQWRRFNPQKPWRGMSMLTSLMNELLFDFNAGSWNKNWFGEGNAVPTGLIKPGMGGAMTPDQRGDMLRTWNQRHGKKRRVGLLPPGAEWIDLGMNQHDMEYVEGRKYAREMMLGSAGLPPFMAGVLENANYANARKQEEVYWQGTIKRLVTSVVNVINTDFLPKLRVKGAVFCAKWQVVNQTLDDFGDKVKIAQNLWQMGVPMVEINERLELGLDVDRIPNADESYVPLQVVPSDMLTEPDDGGVMPEQEASRGITIADGGEVMRALVWRNMVNQRRDLERVFEKIVRSNFKSIEQEALRNLPGWFSGRRGGNVVSINKDEKDLGDLIDREGANDSLRKRTGPQYRNGVQRGANSVLAELGIVGSADIVFGEAAKLVEKLTGKIVTVNESLFDLLGTKLLEGMNAGETLDELRDRVQDVTGLSLGRSRMIARQETGAAFSGGRFAEMQNAGIEFHEWITSRDGFVRPGGNPTRNRGNHVRLDGERVKVGMQFSNGALFPRDPDATAAEAVGCRCEALAVTQ